MAKRCADGSVLSLNRNWARLDENLSRHIDVLLRTPTPSCVAFKAAFREGVVLSVPSFEVRRDPARRPTWSCLGRMVYRNDQEEGPSVCRECRDEDVFTTRSQTLWAGNRDSGTVESWRIGDATCGSCRRRSSLADSDYEMSTSWGQHYYDDDERPECIFQ